MWSMLVLRDLIFGRSSARAGWRHLVRCGVTRGFCQRDQVGIAHATLQV
jgi:hypothetical protein